MSIYDPGHTTTTIETVSTAYDPAYSEHRPQKPIVHTVVKDTHRRSPVVQGDKRTPLPYWSCHTTNAHGLQQSTLSTDAKQYAQGVIAPVNYFAFEYKDAFTGYTEAKEWLDNKLLERIGKTKFELGVEVLEMRETASFVRDKLVYLFRNIQDVRKGRIPRAIKEKRIKRIWTQKRRDRASRMLLEWRYAVGPLMGSIEDGIKLLHDGFTRPEVQHLFSLAKASYTKPLPDRISDTNNYYYTKRTTYSNYKLTAHAKVYYTYSSVFLSDMSQLGASRGDVPQMIWELIPFSFVVDWGIGVADYLNRMGATQGLNFSHGYYAGKSTRTATTVVLPKDVAWIYSTKSKARAELEITSRSVMTRWPSNTIEVSNPLSLYNVATAYALIHQLTAGNKVKR